MPVAVTRVCDLGLPYDRVSGLVVELNLGDVPALQFVEVMRYAPAALVDDGGYYGQPDFVAFVRERRIGGIRGYPLVLAVDQQLRAYNVVPQIDLTSPTFGNQAYNQAYYVPPPVQNYVGPIDPGYVPTVVQTRIAPSFAAGRANFNQPGPEAGVTPQVQRLLRSPNGASVVANPSEVRRELNRNRAQREAPVTVAPTIVASPGAIPERFDKHGRGRTVTSEPVGVTPIVAGTPRDHGKGRGHAAHAELPAPMISSVPQAPVHEHGKGHEAVVPPVATPVATPTPVHEHGRGHAAAGPVSVAPAPAAVISEPAHEHGRGHKDAVPVTSPVNAPQPVHERGRGHAAAPAAPVAVTPTPAPPTATAAPPAGPPGQEKDKKKGKGKDQ
jgi:hypothetical protein